jgi:SAM-dependent methyltransferase
LPQPVATGTAGAERSAAHTAVMTDAPDPVSETRETYDVIARAYRQRKRDRPWDNYLLDLLSRFCARLPAEARVADLGCGHGVEVAVLLERGFEAVGIDLSAGMLACAADLVPGRLAQADLRQLPFADMTLSGIWSVHALLHVPATDMPSALVEMRRVLRPGGWAALSLAGGDCKQREEVAYRPGRYRTFTHWPLDRVVDFAEHAGLKVENSNYAPEGGRDTIWLLVQRPV